jgi:NAD-dependent SIR2 family protein deacetylase
MAFNVLRVARRSFHSASSNPQIQRAAAALQNADYLIIAAGPGLDVGDVNRGSVEMLPDYRRLGRCYSPDTKRWWLEHYPYLAQDRIFPTCDTNFFPEPELFQEQPHVAWGFWGQLFSSYWSTESQTWDANNVRHVWPEAGGKHNLWVYQIIWKWVSQARNLSMAEEVNAENLNLGDVGQTLVQRNAMKNLKSWSIFTSNVSGQFQKYGFDDARIMETHGNFHFLQCSKRCSDDIWPASKSVNQGSQEYWDQLNPFLKDVCSKTRSPTDAFVLAKDDAIVDELGGCMTDTGNGPAVIPAGGSTYLVKHVHRVLPQKTDRQKKIENYLPRCRNCGAIARPTVNMRQFRFNDDPANV